MERLFSHIVDLRDRLRQVDAMTKEEADAIAREVWDDWIEALWWDLQEEVDVYLKKKEAA
jgi:aconitase B